MRFGLELSTYDVALHLTQKLSVRHLTTSEWLIRWDASTEEEWRAVLGFEVDPLPWWYTQLYKVYTWTYAWTSSAVFSVAPLYCSTVTCFTFYSCLPLKYRCSLSYTPFSPREALVTSSQLAKLQHQIRSLVRLPPFQRNTWTLIKTESAVLEAILLLLRELFRSRRNGEAIRAYNGKAVVWNAKELLNVDKLIMDMLWFTAEVLSWVPSNLILN